MTACRYAGGAGHRAYFTGCVVNGTDDFLWGIGSAVCVARPVLAQLKATLATTWERRVWVGSWFRQAHHTC